MSTPFATLPFDGLRRLARRDSMRVLGVGFAVRRNPEWPFGIDFVTQDRAQRVDGRFQNEV